MNILVIGSGGREHALIYGIKRSAKAERIYALPGNGGINRDAIEVNIPVENHKEIADFCHENNIGLVVVGPEAPLVAGITDYLEKENIKVFGASAKAAQLEGSKDFMKSIARKYNIPTAGYESFTSAEKAKSHLEKQKYPIVIKADGLAAGKGVIIAQNRNEANATIDDMFGGKFGDAGKKVVIEEFLEGEEASFFAICDGKTAIAFGSAQDHKRVGDGDTGPNTGGMGTYSPTPVVTEEIYKQIMDKIILPTIYGMKKEGIPYKGFLFAGVMIKDGKAKLLEFNVRMGDPETQVLIPRLKTDLVEILINAANGNIKNTKIEFSDNAALCVVMAAKGYPGEHKKGSVINGIDSISNLKNATVFHAGTKYENGKFLANGGRVLGITALGKNVREAQKLAYRAVDIIDWKDGFCRRDIGWRAIKQ